MIKYDHGKMADILLGEYRRKYGTSGNPSKSIEKLIDCMDDAFVDEWRKCVTEIDDAIVQKAQAAQEMANQTLNELRAEIQQNKETYEDAKEAQEIHDERVVDALKAYQTIVGMDFDTPQQRLQNIQNASYFVWALYAEYGASNMFFKAVTDVKQEDSTEKKWRNVPWN